MPKVTPPVFVEALRLDPEARAELAAELLASLDGSADPNAEAAWAAEIDRRVEAIERGAMRLEPWADVQQRLEKGIVGCDPEVLGGTPVFAGTRVPVKNLIDYLSAGDPLERFLDHFPSVTRAQAVAALELASDLLIASANPAP